MQAESGYVSVLLNVEDLYHHATSYLRDGDGTCIFLNVMNDKCVVANDDFLMEYPEEYRYIGMLADPDDSSDEELSEDSFFENMENDDGFYTPVTELEVS